MESRLASRVAFAVCLRRGPSVAAGPLSLLSGLRPGHALCLAHSPGPLSEKPGRCVRQHGAFLAGDSRVTAVSGRLRGCTWGTARRTWPSPQPLQGPRLLGQAGPSLPRFRGQEGGTSCPRRSGALPAHRVLSPAAPGLPGEQRCEGRVRVQRATLLLPAHALRLPVSDGAVGRRGTARGPGVPPGRARGRGRGKGGHTTHAPGSHPRATRPHQPPCRGLVLGVGLGPGRGRRSAVCSSRRGPRPHCEPARPGNHPET